MLTRESMRNSDVLLDLIRKQCSIEGLRAEIVSCGTGLQVKVSRLGKSRKISIMNTHYELSTQKIPVGREDRVIYLIERMFYE